MDKIPISSIQKTFQSEGPLLGHYQLIIDVALSNIQDDSINVATQTISPEDIISHTKKAHIHSICFQSGEILLLIPLLLKIRQLTKLPIYIKTNGTLTQHLEECLPLINYLGIYYTPENIDSLTDILAMIESHPYRYISLNVKKSTPTSELIEVAKLTSLISPPIPLIIQPAYQLSRHPEKPHSDTITKLHKTLLKHHQNTRLIPQIPSRLWP